MSLTQGKMMNILTPLKNLTLIPLFLTATLVGCASQLSDSTHISSGKSYPATQAEHVAILFEAPDKAFIVIGLVESHGMGLTKTKEQERSMMALKKEAASIGADAVIITSSKNETVIGLNGDPAGEENILAAKAIKFK